MRVLAIDTALAACSAALLDTGSGAILASDTRMMSRGHAEMIMPIVARVMARAKVEFDELDRIAVTVGPGSFTGLRVGIAAARGIALASGKPAVGLSTLAGFAAPHIAKDDGSALVAVIDARHGNVYMQVFAAGGRTLFPPQVVPLAEAVQAAVTQDARVVGSAANLLAAAWPAAEKPPLLVDQRGAPGVEWIARLGAAAVDGHGSPKPLYLRPADAHPQDGGRLPRR